jgi:hypothetical protein
MKSFNIQELLHRKSKQHRTKPMHPSSVRAFQRHQEHNLKHPGSVELITPKKLLSFIDRLEIDHVGQEQHKMKQQKAKQSLIGFHPDFVFRGWGALFQILGLNKTERNILSQFLAKFPQILKKFQHI